MHWALRTFLYSLCVVGPLAVSGCVRAASDSETGNWLSGLNQSPLTPQDYVFGVVWALLYLLVGLSLAVLVHTALQTGFQNGQWSSMGFFVTGILFYVAQLCANYSYLVVMFQQRDLNMGLKLLYLVLAFTAFNILCFAPVSALAAALLLPYAAYLLVAYRLQAYLLANNPEKGPGNADKAEPTPAVAV